MHEDINTTVTTMQPEFDKDENERIKQETEPMAHNCYIEVVPFSPQQLGCNIDQPSERRKFWASVDHPSWICVSQNNPPFTFQINEDFLGYSNDFTALMSPWPSGIVAATTIAKIEMTSPATIKRPASNVVSISEAFKIALGTLKTFRRKWDAYIEQEARTYSVFEDEDSGE
jgi:hypothetical protein